LQRWVGREYRGQAGRWLRRARYPERFERVLSQHSPAVNVLGHFKYDSGLQQEAFQHVGALQRAGYRTFLRDVPIAYPRDCSCASLFCDPEIGPITLIKTGASEPLDDIYRRAGLHPRPGVYRIACWSWELEDFPREVLERAGLADEVWTPSEFCTRSVQAALPDKPVITMNPSVTLPAFEPRPRSHFHLPPDRYLFLFMFDMASGMERKNPLGLIRAYVRAFRHDDAVQLVLKVSRGSSCPNDLARLQDAAREAGGVLLDRVMPRPEVAALLACCDCYVSLHRSEGFGFTMAEAMLMGKPTIATGYSGNLDFMSPDNSFLVRHERVVLDRDLPPYRAGCVWSAPSEEHAAERMRWIYEHREEAETIAAKGQATVIERLSESAAADRITARLRQLRGAARV
jgi:glycosyltransferase involved in cell wall biosynthesis